METILYFALSDSVEVTDEADDEGGEEDEECRGPSARSGSGSHLESASRILLSERRGNRIMHVQRRTIVRFGPNFSGAIPACPSPNER